MKKNTVVPLNDSARPPLMENTAEQKIVIHHGVFNKNLNIEDFKALTTGSGTTKTDFDYHGCIME